MGDCPFHSSDRGETDRRTAHEPDDREQSPERVTPDRRAFIKSALLIGGAGAVGSLERVAGLTMNVRAAETAPITAVERRNRQHAWDAYEPRGASGNTAPPPNSLFLLLEYQGDGEPSPGQRRQVEEALAEIERHFEWRPDGVMFTMAYSARYFDRFDEDPPAGAVPDDPETVVDTVQELTDLADTNDAIMPDTHDALLLLASKHEANLLAVEAALWGADALDVTFDATFEDVFSKPEAWPDRRIGLAGPAFQTREADYEKRFLDDNQQIPDEAPLSMGFVAGFGESIPAEEAVTLQQGQRFPAPEINEEEVPDLAYVGDVGERDPGVFAQGTLKHLSHIDLNLSEWYGEAEDQRRHQMYSPYHTAEETRNQGGDKPGSGLTADEDGPNDGPDQDELTVLEYAERTPTTAAGDDAYAEASKPTVGHSQKTARARYDVDGDGDVEQPVLRRDWDNIAPVGPDGADRAGYHFNVPMRFNESIYTLLDATYNIEFKSLDGDIVHDGVGDNIKERNGIAPYMRATRRSNWLVPPITLRALPYPRAEEAVLSVTKNGQTYIVTVSGIDPAGGRLDRETVRFGPVEMVNQAGGARPEDVSRRANEVTFRFEWPNADGPSEGDQIKLFGKRVGTRKPVVGVTAL